MAQDLRSYLDLVKRRTPGDFEIVTREVDPAYQITDAQKRKVLADNCRRLYRL